MSGYNTLKFIHNLEKEISELGFKITRPNHSSYDTSWQDSVALVPKDNDSLPIYSRDAEIVIGTLEELETWIKGVNWSRKYDQHIGLSDKKKRERKEQDERNKQLIQKLKNETSVLKK